MIEDWQDKNWVQKWDTDTARGNPTRPEQLDILVSILVDNYQPGTVILDIGFGSGQVEELIFKRNKDIKIIGVDSSKPMIERARERLADYKNNFQAIEKNLTALELSDLPADKARYVFSVQVLHELAKEEKLVLLSKIYKFLEPGGSFLIMDRVSTDLKTFSESYKTIWDRLEKLTDLKNGKSYSDYQEKIGGKGDSPATEEEYLNLLRQVGFKAATLHLHFDRAIIIGVK